MIDRPLQRGTAARTAVKGRYTKKYAKYIVYKNARRENL